MYEDMTPERIKSEILKSVEEKLDTRQGSFSDDMAGPIAVELYKMYTALNAVRPMVWVNETSGEYLDSAAEDLGVEPRKAGQKARVSLALMGTAGYTAPQGRTFTTADGLYYITLGPTEFDESGAAWVTAEAEYAGAAYNVPEGAVCGQFQNDGKIRSVTNPTPAEGGTEPEDDAELYARITAARKKPSTSGNIYDYEKWATATAGVGAARVTPIWNGPGTVKVLIADGDRQPVDTAIVEACAAHIEKVRPVGASVTVRSASALSVNAEATVTLDGSRTLEETRQAFAEALNSYFHSLAFTGSAVLHNRVGALLIGVDGVVDYANLLLNGAEENLAVGEDFIPTAGEVTLRESV